MHSRPALPASLKFGLDSLTTIYTVLSRLFRKFLKRKVKTLAFQISGVAPLSFSHSDTRLLSIDAQNLRHDSRNMSCSSLKIFRVPISKRLPDCQFCFLDACRSDILRRLFIFLFFDSSEFKLVLTQAKIEYWVSVM